MVSGRSVQEQFSSNKEQILEDSCAVNANKPNNNEGNEEDFGSVGSDRVYDLKAINMRSLVWQGRETQTVA